MAYGMFLPDGNTLVPTGVFNAMVDDLRNQYLDNRDAARDRSRSRDMRLFCAKLATVCRLALRSIANSPHCRAQTRII